MNILVGLKLWDKLKDSVSQKIELEEDIEKIRLFVRNFARTNIGLGWTVFECISAKLENEKDIGKIGAFVSDITDVNSALGWELAASIKIKPLLDKIKKEKDIKKLNINEAYPMQAKEIHCELNKLNTELIKELNKDSNVKSLFDIY